MADYRDDDPKSRRFSSRICTFDFQVFGRVLIRAAERKRGAKCRDLRLVW